MNHGPGETKRSFRVPVGGAMYPIPEPVRMNVIETKFFPGQKVNIDGCKDLAVTITAVQWRHPTVINYECSWVSNGDSKHDVIEGWRLTEATE